MPLLRVAAAFTLLATFVGGMPARVRRWPVLFRSVRCGLILVGLCALFGSAGLALTRERYTYVEAGSTPHVREFHASLLEALDYVIGSFTPVQWLRPLVSVLNWARSRYAVADPDWCRVHGLMGCDIQETSTGFIVTGYAVSRASAAATLLQEAIEKVTDAVLIARWALGTTLQVGGGLWNLTVLSHLVGLVASGGWVGFAVAAWLSWRVLDVVWLVASPNRLAALARLAGLGLLYPGNGVYRWVWLLTFPAQLFWLALRVSHMLLSTSLTATFISHRTETIGLVTLDFAAGFSLAAFVLVCLVCTRRRIPRIVHWKETLAVPAMHAPCEAGLHREIVAGVLRRVIVMEPVLPQLQLTKRGFPTVSGWAFVRYHGRNPVMFFGGRSTARAHVARNLPQGIPRQRLTQLMEALLRRVKRSMDRVTMEDMLQFAAEHINTFTGAKRTRYEELYAVLFAQSWAAGAHALAVGEQAAMRAFTKREINQSKPRMFGTWGVAMNGAVSDVVRATAHMVTYPYHKAVGHHMMEVAMAEDEGKLIKPRVVTFPSTLGFSEDDNYMAMSVAVLIGMQVMAKAVLKDTRMSAPNLDPGVDLASLANQLWDKVMQITQPANEEAVYANVRAAYQGLGHVPEGGTCSLLGHTFCSKLLMPAWDIDHSEPRLCYTVPFGRLVQRMGALNGNHGAIAPAVHLMKLDSLIEICQGSLLQTTILQGVRDFVSRIPGAEKLGKVQHRFDEDVTRDHHFKTSSDGRLRFRPLAWELEREFWAAHLHCQTVEVDAILEEARRIRRAALAAPVETVYSAEFGLEMPSAPLDLSVDEFPLLNKYACHSVDARASLSDPLQVRGAMERAIALAATGDPGQVDAMEELLAAFDAEHATQGDVSVGGLVAPNRGKLKNLIAATYFAKHCQPDSLIVMIGCGRSECVEVVQAITQAHRTSGDTYSILCVDSSKAVIDELLKTKFDGVLAQPAFQPDGSVTLVPTAVIAMHPGELKPYLDARRPNAESISVFSDVPLFKETIAQSVESQLIALEAYRVTRGVPHGLSMVKVSSGAIGPVRYAIDEDGRLESPIDPEAAMRPARNMRHPAITSLDDPLEPGTSILRLKHHRTFESTGRPSLEHYLVTSTGPDPLRPFVAISTKDERWKRGSPCARQYLTRVATIAAAALAIHFGGDVEPDWFPRPARNVTWAELIPEACNSEDMVVRDTNRFQHARMVALAVRCGFPANIANARVIELDAVSADGSHQGTATMVNTAAMARIRELMPYISPMAGHDVLKAAVYSKGGCRALLTRSVSAETDLEIRALLQEADRNIGDVATNSGLYSGLPTTTAINEIEFGLAIRTGFAAARLGVQVAAMRSEQVEAAVFEPPVVIDHVIAQTGDDSAAVFIPVGS